MSKVTNEDIDKRLVGRNIQRVGDYINARTPLKWRCLVEGCGYEWSTTSDNIFNKKSGCQCCYKEKRKLNNLIIDEKLVGRNIERVGDYKGCYVKIRWRCLVEGCGYEWYAQPNNVLNASNGCNKCSSSKGEKLVAKTLMDLQIEYEIEKRFDTCRNILPLPFDFFIPSHNLLIEYNGSQHYEPVKWNKLMTDDEATCIYEGLVARDKIKKRWAKKNGYKLLILTYEMTNEMITTLIKEAVNNNEQRNNT